MKLNNLAVANGVVGLVGGIVLLFGGWFILGSAAAGAKSLGTMSVVFLLLKVAIFVLGIIGLIQFNKAPISTKSPSVLMIVGGAISFIPLTGLIGGIIAIIGGSMYLSGLKKIKSVTN